MTPKERLDERRDAIECVVAELEAYYHPQNPKAMHPADFVTKIFKLDGHENLEYCQRMHFATPPEIRTILSQMGYVLTIEPWDALDPEKYTHILKVWHMDDPETHVIIPIHKDEDDGEIIEALFEQKRSIFATMNKVLGAWGGCHEPGVRFDPYDNVLEEWLPRIEYVRHKKEQALMNQDFEWAAAWRDEERILARYAK